MPREIYDKASPYYRTPQTSRYLGIWEPRYIPRDGSDSLISIDTKYTERPDLLAYDLYGFPDYWWIFAIRNPDVIKDPIFDMQPGVLIYVPTQERLRNILG